MIEDVTSPLAFPSQSRGTDGLPDDAAVPGMTLRDWFAGQAIGALIRVTDADPAFVASYAYQYADYMLKARK